MSQNKVKTPRKHAELIKAWADNEDIQVFNPMTMKWEDVAIPCWAEDAQYRIKPKSYSTFQEFTINNSPIYVLIPVGNDWVVLIDKKHYCRWSNAVRVKDIMNITHDEMMQITDNHEPTLIS